MHLSMTAVLTWEAFCDELLHSCHIHPHGCLRMHLQAVTALTQELLHILSTTDTCQAQQMKEIMFLMLWSECKTCSPGVSWKDILVCICATGLQRL